jgi:hypothetical protein
MVESIEGVGSVIGVGFGFWRFGRGELGGEVADIVVVEGIVQRNEVGGGRRVDARGSRRVLPLNSLRYTQGAYFKAYV